MESLSTETKKLVSYFAGYLATSIDLIRAATLLSTQHVDDFIDFRFSLAVALIIVATPVSSLIITSQHQIHRIDLKLDHDDEKSSSKLIQIGEQMIGRTQILSSAFLSDSVQGVAVEREGVLALRDYVVLLKVNGDDIDLQIVTEGSSLRSLPVEPLSVDLIVCVFGSPESLAVQMLSEFKRVLKLESEIFLIQTEKSASKQLEPLLVMKI
ncbi:hypothetical protein OROHE_007349 [Orobanche hederae]